MPRRNCNKNQPLHFTEKRVEYLRKIHPEIEVLRFVGGCPQLLIGGIWEPIEITESERSVFNA